MMLIAGTLPVQGLPLLSGQVRWEDDSLVIDGHAVPCMQGTAAMLSAALVTTGYFGLEAPRALVAGDTGQGNGSKEIYEYLIRESSRLAPHVLALHYCLPDMGLTRRLCASLKGCARWPFMIADAGSMYAAKAAGLAPEFDVFTPDATEMAFLADPEATHPAYIARHLFDLDIRETPRLVSAAYRQNNAAKLLLVKGAVDYIAADGQVLETVDRPDVPALEAIGGTGDTITGLISALVYAGLQPVRAAVIAARVNRAAGEQARSTPSTRVWQIIAEFPSVFRSLAAFLPGRPVTARDNVDLLEQKEENQVIEVDARGLSCPIPVVKTRAAIERHPGRPIVVLVETVASKENVSRLARNGGYSVTEEAIEDGFRLLLDP